jgi:hypothetical protein
LFFLTAVFFLLAVYYALYASYRHFCSQWKRNVSLYGSSATGTFREGYLIRDPEGYVKDGFGNGQLSP